MKPTNISKTISKLNRETKENIIKWNVVNNNTPSSLSGEEKLNGIVYRCTVNEKTLRLYKFQTRHYTDEYNYVWVDDYRLEFINTYGNSEFSFGIDRAIHDLYETVQYKTSGIESFMDTFLKEDNEDV